MYHLPKERGNLTLTCLVSLSIGAGAVAGSNPNYKAVNLGGWLVTERWIEPSLFDGIPNKDLLDGTKVQFRSVTQDKYLSAEGGGGMQVVANRPRASDWETFRLWRISETTFNFRVSKGQLMGLNKQGQGINLMAVSETRHPWNTFEIVRKSDDLNRIRIKAPNGSFLQVKMGELVTTDATGDTSWGNDDLSIFTMTIISSLGGEFQLTNGYGTEKATEVLKAHWTSYIMEEDFKFMSDNDLNAVRIPVGWWIAYDTTPPKPFVGGSLESLDNAFLWPQYASKPSLLVVELINKPHLPAISLESLTKYYRAGYEAIRKHSPTAYVIMSNRLGQHDPRELFPLASGLERTVINVHYYNLFSNTFQHMNVQQNIDFIYNIKSKQLNTIITSNGPLTFVGNGLLNGTLGEQQRMITRDLQRPN